MMRKCFITFKKLALHSINMWYVKSFLICACMLIVLANDEHNCDQTYSMFQKLANLEAKIKSLEEKFMALESASAGTNANAQCRYVAFRATLTKSLGTVPLGQTIIFDKVELNIGNAYHPYQSVFTAPCNGTYLFSIKIGNINKAGNIHLKVNDVTAEYAWGGYNGNWDMGGVATVVYLVAGDDVWVEGRGVVDGNGGSDGVGETKQTGFAGTLLHAF